MIIHVPRGDTWQLTVKSPFARYAMVCSTSRLENRIDSMTPEEAEQARVNLKERFPVDIGQEYMMDYIMSHNAGSLWDKMTARPSRDG